MSHWRSDPPPACLTDTLLSPRRPEVQHLQERSLTIRAQAGTLGLGQREAPSRMHEAGISRVGCTGPRDGRPDPKILGSVVPDLALYCVGSSGCWLLSHRPGRSVRPPTNSSGSFVSFRPSGLWVFEILPRHNGPRQMPNSQMGRQRSVRDSRAAQINASGQERGES